MIQDGRRVLALSKKQIFPHGSPAGHPHLIGSWPRYPVDHTHTYTSRLADLQFPKCMVCFTPLHGLPFLPSFAWWTLACLPKCCPNMLFHIFLISMFLHLSPYRLISELLWFYPRLAFDCTRTRTTYLTLFPQCLILCLVHSGCSINVERMTAYLL